MILGGVIVCFGLPVAFWALGMTYVFNAIFLDHQIANLTGAVAIELLAALGMLGVISLLWRIGKPKFLFHRYVTLMFLAMGILAILIYLQPQLYPFYIPKLYSFDLLIFPPPIIWTACLIYIFRHELFRPNEIE